MAKASDISGKVLVGLSPEEWVRWATGVTDATGCELLSGEFQTLSRATDALVKVSHSSAGTFLVLFELQTIYRRTMPRRLRAYAGLAEEAYQLPVYPVLVNFLPYSKEIPTRYESNFLGLVARQDYRVINLWEVLAEDAFSQHLTSLLPLVPLMRDGNTEAMALRAQVQLSHSVEWQGSERLGDALTALNIFASLVLDPRIVARVLGGDMETLIRTPFYQEVLRQGRVEGRVEGRQEGIQLGIQRVIFHHWERRFGAVSEDLRAKIEALPIEKAEELADVLLDSQDVSEARAWLEQNEATH